MIKINKSKNYLRINIIIFIIQSPITKTKIADKNLGP